MEGEAVKAETPSRARLRALMKTADRTTQRVVLALALADRNVQNAAEIAEFLDLPEQKVQAILDRLADRNFIHRFTYEQVHHAE